MEWEGLIESGEIKRSTLQDQLMLRGYSSRQMKNYSCLDQKIVQHCFRMAISKYAVPSSVYFDYGKQYRTKWMQGACGRLGIRLLYAKPYSPESTGKIE